jgi:hypothetical protein
MDGVRTSTANSRQSTMQRKAKLETVIRDIEILTGDQEAEIKDINQEMERQESQRKVLLDIDH